MAIFDKLFSAATLGAIGVFVGGPVGGAVGAGLGLLVGGGDKPIKAAAPVPGGWSPDLSRSTGRCACTSQRECRMCSDIDKAHAARERSRRR